MAYKIEAKNLQDAVLTREQAEKVLTRYFGYCPKFRLPRFGKQSIVVPPKYMASAGIYDVTITAV
ncbi:MAG TPA: hypothetical protein ENG95_05945 [Nitrospirae bacterium]|nr:hypothetical protein [Nitrospirota bacterium]